jgi:hypothetical protein
MDCFGSHRPGGETDHRVEVVGRLMPTRPTRRLRSYSTFQYLYTPPLAKMLLTSTYTSGTANDIPVLIVCYDSRRVFMLKSHTYAVGGCAFFAIVASTLIQNYQIGTGIKYSAKVSNRERVRCEY